MDDEVKPSKKIPSGAAAIESATDNFKDLEAGTIDIIDYLQGSSGSAQGGIENIYGFLTGDESVSSGNSSVAKRVRMDVGLLSAGSVHPSHQLHHVNSQSHLQTLQSSVGLGQNNGAMRAAHYGPANGRMTHMSERAPPAYDHTMTRLPESPPETDSGGGSAGSPSGSETSPCSPEYQGYMQSKDGSVIHAAVGGNPQQQGVILSVPNLDNHVFAAAGLSDFPFYNHPPTAGTIHHHPGSQTPSASTGNLGPPPLRSVSNGHMNTNGDFYANVPTPGPQPGVVPHQQVSPNGYLPPSAGQHYTNLLPQQHYDNSGDLGASRKRLRSENGQYVPQIKPEPSSPLTHCSDDSLYDDGVNHQTIRFNEFQKESWNSLCDMNGRDLPPLGFHVVADKGFNFSAFDSAFVNQKKNHFQVSVHIEVRDKAPPKFVRVAGEGGGLKPISEFQLDFYGVKAEMVSSLVQIKQSQTDRRPIPYEPVKLDLPPNRVTKVTVARLHFSETTMNNQRKNGRPNPDQKYFLLTCSLNAIVQGTEKYPVVSYASERVIVRASNPGQFDNGEPEAHWQKGQTANSLFYPGIVGIGTDRPNATLTVAGDISYTGQLYHPSDRRLKENIRDINTAEALARMSQIRIVRYCIRPEIAEQFGLTPEECERVGVIAQEVEEILPDAIKENDDYLQVDESRIFYESAAAVQELCRLTGNLEFKIEEVEKISKKLSRLSALRRFDSLRSCASKVSGYTDSYLSSCSQLSVVAEGEEKLTDRRHRKCPDHRRNRRDGSAEDLGSDREFDDKHSGGLCSSSRHRHHRCHHYCRRTAANDRGICNNKIIQTTVIILVVVMAFCLIAMATLYILDWHKRNYQKELPYASSPVDPGKDPGKNTQHPDGPGNIIQQNTTPLPPIVPVTLPIPNPPWEDHPDDHLFMPPPIRECFGDCRMYCCSANLGLSTTGSWFTAAAVKSMASTGLSPIKQIPIGADFRYSVKSVRKEADGVSGLNNHTEENRTVHKAIEATRLAGKLPVGNTVIIVNKPVDSDDSTEDVVIDPANRRIRRGIQESLSGADVVVTIPMLNVTIGDRYCYGLECGDEKFGKLMYYVPVSRYLPTFSLDLDIEVAEGWNAKLCDHQVGDMCSGMDSSDDQSPTSEMDSLTANSDSSNGRVEPVQTESGSWKLPIGQHTRSAYKFRVSQSSTQCEEDADAAGSTYFEYHLFFYRICSS